MFYVKIAFWLILIMILLPSNAREKNEFYGVAQRSMNEISSFCTHNSKICEKSNSFADTMYQKFVNTGELVGDVVNGHSKKGTTASQKRQEPQRREPRRSWRDSRLDTDTRTASTDSFLHNTLTAEDLVPDWSGPRPRSMAYHK
jgi:hypothetical protein